MKRDMEKVRGVMLALEAFDGPFLMSHSTGAMGGTESGVETVEYLVMLESAGFLDRSQGSVFRISWAGHEFLDNVRDPEIWKKTKAGANKVGSWSVSILAELAKGYVRAKAESLGLPLG